MLEVSANPRSIHWNPKVPIILAGGNTSYRNDIDKMNALRANGEQPITVDMGNACAEELGCDCYMDFDSHTQEGLQDLFEKACHLVHAYKLKSKCIIL